MEVVKEVVDRDAFLQQVDPENRDCVEEIILNDDCYKGFLCFDEDDLENDEKIANLTRGNLDTRGLAFDAVKKLKLCHWTKSSDNRFLQFNY